MLIARPHEIETHRGFSTCMNILNNDLESYNKSKEVTTL